MPSSTNTTNITPPRVPFLDERTGLISREWYRFFLSLFELVGGGQNDTSLLDMQYAPVLQPIPPIPDLNDFDNAPNSSPVLSQVAEMGKAVQGLQSIPIQPLGSFSVINQDWVPYVGFTAAPSWMGTQTGQLWFNSATNQLNIQQGANVTQQIGEELYHYGKASSAISDTNLQLVYKTGVVGASGTITFAPTVAGITDPNLIVGVATETIALNGFGRVTTYGIVHGINTTGSAYGEVWANNDDIWYNPVTGNPTKVKPNAPNIKLQIGTIVNAGAGSSGSFFVRLGTSSQLGGTDSNVQITSVANNDALIYNSTNSRWENYTPVNSRTALGLGSGTPTNGQLLIGNGTNFTTSAMTSLGGTISITSGAGTLNIEAVGVSGASGTFTTADTPPKTVTVTNGIITSIV